MQLTPSGERPFPTPPTPNAQDLESARFANRDAVVLPDEMVTRILMNLGTTDIAVCRSVNRHWQALIDTQHLLARSFYRDCHLTQRVNSLAAQRKLTVERYHSHIQGWLTGYSNKGRETAEQLDNFLGNIHFPEVLFFSIPKLLLNTNELTCHNTATIKHSGSVTDASFSPDGKYLMTVSTDNAAKLWQLEDGKWEKTATLEHSARVFNASFSPDGKFLVTTSCDRICKIWRLEDDQWQEKDTIEHPTSVRYACFSPDGKHLVIVPSGILGSVKIWRHVDGKWQEKDTIKSSGRGDTNAHFSPDGKHLVTASRDGIVKICGLVDGKWEVKFIIRDCCSVTDARISPDGKHLVTVASGDFTHYAKLWELVDDQSQENATIQRWQEKVTLQHPEAVNNVHFSPDGKHLVTASRNGTANIFGLVGGNWQIKATVWSLGPVTNASFSCDGKFLVTAASDGTVNICGLVGGKWQVKNAIWHSEAVTNASFGPDSYQFVTASRDNTAKIWVLQNLGTKGYGKWR